MVILVEDEPEVGAEGLAGADDGPVAAADASPEMDTREAAVIERPVDISLDMAVDRRAVQPADTLLEKPVVASSKPPAVAKAQPRSQQPATQRQQPRAMEPVVAPAERGRTDSQASADARSGQARAGSGGVGQVAAGPRRVSHLDYLGGPPNAVYPQRAKGRKQQGQVIVRVSISSAGQISRADVLKTSGFEALDQAALDAVLRTRFRPYSENGHPYDALADIPFEFVLKN